MNKRLTYGYSRYYQTILNIIFLFLVFSTALLAGDKRCRFCGKLITGSYLEVHGYYYHPEHFLCNACEKPIQGEFNKDGVSFYHPTCFIDVKGLRCASCDQIITGEYFEANDKKYHPTCYRDNILPRCGWCDEPIEDNYFDSDGKQYHDWCYRDHILPKCDICGKPLEERYLEDAFGNKYHSQHTAEFPTCDNCGRLISDRTSRSGVTYSDGRHICTLCFQSAIKNIDAYYRSFDKVNQVLGKMGFQVDLSQVDIKPVDRDQLKSIAGRDYTDQLRGYCNTRTQFLNGNLTERSHTIYILNDVPELTIESTMAHELMHIWIVQNTNIDHQAILEEGSCNYLSYLYLSEYNNPDSAYLIRHLMESSDPVYGEGFRRVRERFGQRPLNMLFDYLKNHSTL